MPTDPPAPPVPPLTRREALRATAVTVGALAAAGALGACSREPRQAESRRAEGGDAAGARLAPADRALLEEIADTILPTTEASPGAKAAGAGAAMELLLVDCYEPEARRRVERGLGELRALCRSRCADGFAALPRPERERLLLELDAQARRAGDDHWFHLARELALRAYFSSEVGMTRALRYVMIPGRWTGCLPLEPGQPAWG
jgi:hypothetical protein